MVVSVIVLLCIHKSKTLSLLCPKYKDIPKQMPIECTHKYGLSGREAGNTMD